MHALARRSLSLLRPLGLVLLLAGVALLPPPHALGQPATEAPAPDPADGNGPSRARVLTDPETGERYVEVRPSSTLERGRWPVEPFVVWAVGALGVLGGALVLTRRVLRARRGR